MNNVDNFRKILDKQKEIVTDLDGEIRELEKSDLITENARLKEELTTKETVLEKISGEKDLLETENKQLKNALYEQIYNEKLAILNTSSEKLEVYFQDNYEKEVNRLANFEVSTRKRIDEMTAVLRENRIAIEDETYQIIGKLNELLNQKITLLREELTKKNWQFRRDMDEHFNKLKEEPLTEEQLKGVVKKNNLESLIGLNFLNKVGILLLIIGIIAASQYTLFKLPDIFKGIFGFMVGAVLLVTGEILNRKRANVFSLGLTSAGIAVLFTTLALSYFQLEIISMYPALLLCILTTIGAFVLALRYNAQTIAAFALIGGYLPLLSIADSKVLVYSAMGYLMILNLFALLLSTQKKWTVTSFLGFFLNVAGTMYILDQLLDSRDYSAFALNDLPALCYVAFAFLIYTLIPICSTYFKGLRFQKSDIVLLALNTAISTILMYAVFYAVELENFTGLLALIFAVLYLSLGRFLQRHLYREKSARALFYLTGLTFVVLIIPFQFGKVWLSLGWLIEGTALLVFGIAKEWASFRKAGAIIFGLCLVSFLELDVFGVNYSHLFFYKYFAVTLGSVIILAAAYLKRALSTRAINLFKYGTTINLWLFLMYFISDILAMNLDTALVYSYWNVDYLVFALMTMVSFLLAYLIPRNSLLCDGVMKGISVFIYLWGLGSLLVLNTYAPNQRFLEADLPWSLLFTGSVVLVVINLLAVFALRDLVLRLALERKLGLEWYPLIVSSYFILALTEILISQYSLQFTNAAISIIYVVAALSWIIFGFVKRYAFIRRCGLALAVFAVAKLFLLDLSFLSDLARIFSYFAFGLTLLAISFVYQHFNKKLEIKGEILPDEQKAQL